MIKFNDTHIYVGYIKQLLHSFNLPQCRIGIVEKDLSSQKSFYYIKGNVLYFYNADEGKSKRLQNYKFGDRIEGITKNLEIKNNYYDSYTHEYLGEYLRYLRDYMNLDLMSMYNCFSNASAKNFKLDYKDIKFNTNDNSYNIFVVPVKFDKKYTIAIDWHGEIEMFTSFYSDGGEVNSAIEGVDFKDLADKTHVKFSGMRFNHPKVYDKLDADKFKLTPDYSKEKCLRLFIKVPLECKSSIVVLEGDYTKDTEIYINENKKQVLGNSLLLYKPEIISTNDQDEVVSEVREDIILGYEYLSKRQLLMMNTESPILLADRLVEYLSENAINPLDPIVENIKRLQRKIAVDKVAINPNYLREFNVEYFGMWDNNIREFLYQTAREMGYTNTYYDVLGYLDKDLETKIGGLDLIKDKENDVWQPAL